MKRSRPIKIQQIPDDGADGIPIIPDKIIKIAIFPRFVDQNRFIKVLLSHWYKGNCIYCNTIFRICKILSESGKIGLKLAKIELLSLIDAG